MYPKYGPSQLWETVAKEIESMGGKIHFNKKIEKIKIENNKAVFIGTKYNEVIDNIDYLISTMPVKDLIYSISLMNEVPDEVKITASKLQYRDFITVGLLLKDISLHNKNGIVKDNWIYIQEPYVKVARLQLFNNWSPYMVSDKNLHYLGMEYMCFEDDELWSMSDNDFIKFAVEEMKSLKLIKDEYIVSSNIVKIKKAYPSYTGSYNEFYKNKRLCR
ncbi:FAD-dependent oxidoreductase [Brachyspira hyodysenteriae]|nr:FAD-dependent oxidoreductase [Brachyspira hyodysenteriae]MDA0034952.1 FAD-dependent oxidoreductase [Brachyspira hyodysenteriae]